MADDGEKATTFFERFNAFHDLGWDGVLSKAESALYRRYLQAMGNKTCEAWPGLGKLAKQLGHQKTHNLITARHRLVELGLLTFVRAGPGPCDPPIYRVNVAPPIPGHLAAEVSTPSKRKRRSKPETPSKPKSDPLLPLALTPSKAKTHNFLIEPLSEPLSAPSQTPATSEPKPTHRPAALAVDPAPALPFAASAASAAPPAQPAAPFRQFTDYWLAAKRREDPLYKFGGSREGKIMAEIWDQLDNNLELARRVVDAYLGDEQKFYEGHKASKLRSDIETFRTRANRKDHGTPKQLAHHRQGELKSNLRTQTRIAPAGAGDHLRQPVPIAR